MKKLLILFLFYFLLSACGNNKADQPGTDDDTARVAQSHYVWQSTLNDSTGKLELVPLEQLSSDSLQPKSVIGVINKTNIETGFSGTVRLEFIKTSGDTVYVKIPDATYLTQQMGSTGPTLFFAGVAYTLTGLSGINYVNFDFDEGDHAAPGTYNRESFKDE